MRTRWVPDWGPKPGSSRHDRRMHGSERATRPRHLRRPAQIAGEKAGHRRASRSGRIGGRQARTLPSHGPVRSERPARSASCIISLCCTAIRASLRASFVAAGATPRDCRSSRTSRRFCRSRTRPAFSVTRIGRWPFVSSWRHPTHSPRIRGRQRGRSLFLIGLSATPNNRFVIWGVVHTGPRQLPSVRAGEQHPPPLPDGALVVPAPGRIEVARGSSIITEMRGGLITERGWTSSRRHTPSMGAAYPTMSQSEDVDVNGILFAQRARSSKRS